MQDWRHCSLICNECVVWHWKLANSQLIFLVMAGPHASYAGSFCRLIIRHLILTLSSIRKQSLGVSPIPGKTLIVSAAWTQSKIPARSANTKWEAELRILILANNHLNRCFFLYSLPDPDVLSPDPDVLSMHAVQTHTASACIPGYVAP